MGSLPHYGGQHRGVGMTATDETATEPAPVVPLPYLPRSASAHVSASQPTGLTQLGTAVDATPPKRRGSRR